MRLTPNQGFTLLELIIVVLILSIIVGMSSSLLVQGLSTYSIAEGIVNANWQGQLATERMSRDIRLANSPASITSIGTNTFAFSDVENNTISYSLNGTSLTLTQNGNPAILADGIQSLTFTYFDKNGATTNTASLVRFIRVSINVIQGNANFNLTTAINPRNLP